MILTLYLNLTKAPAGYKFRAMFQDQVGISKTVIIISTVVILLLIGGAGLFLKSRIDKLTAEPSPTPVENPVTNFQSTPEPTPEFNRSQYTIRVLNGTKTSGLAASVSAKLKDLGYEISKTGNASSSAQTLIKVKESASGLLEQLIEDLSPDFNTEEGGSLKDSDDADAEVILGAK